MGRSCVCGCLNLVNSVPGTGSGKVCFQYCLLNVRMVYQAIQNVSC